MKVGWSGLRYRIDGRWNMYYRFKVYADSGDVILSAASVIKRGGINKRRWRPSRVFWKVDQYYKGDVFQDLIIFHSCFEIDPEKLKRRIKIKDNL
jgi:hypothetical protein